MTDEQIIKAFEMWLRKGDCNGECPLLEMGYCFDCACVPPEIASGILALINRQKAKNEREINQIKFEAIKEFAERLKRKIWHSDWCNLEMTITPEIITNLVKEMTEEQK